MTLEEMRKAKQSKGYTIAQIAEYTKIPLGTVQKIFSGATKAPRFETMQALEQLLLPGNRTLQVEEELAYSVSKSASQRKKTGRYTADDYYTLSDDRRVELLDGEIYDMSAPTYVHQKISGCVYMQLVTQIRAKKGNCDPSFAPVDVRLDCDDKTIVQPDMMIVCDKSKIKNWGILGAPDFILEVSSDSTKKRDYFQKMIKYMEAGVQEYWIINPDRRDVTVYDFPSEEGPRVYPLKGSLGLAMYHGEIQIDLDEVAAEIRDYSADDESGI